MLEHILLLLKKKLAKIDLSLYTDLVNMFLISER